MPLPWVLWLVLVEMLVFSVAIVTSVVRLRRVPMSKRSTYLVAVILLLVAFVLTAGSFWLMVHIRSA